jgi:hypothetical protein
MRGRGTNNMQITKKGHEKQGQGFFLLTLLCLTVQISEANHFRPPKQLQVTIDGPSIS